MAVLVLLASGCGDDSAATGDRFDTSAGADSDGGSDDGGGGGDSDGGSDDGGSDDDPGAGGLGDGSNSDFCNFSDNINSGLDDVDPLTMGPDDIESSFRQIADNIDRAAAIAPGEIRDDVQVLVDGVSGFMEVLGEYDYDMFSIPEDIAVAVDTVPGGCTRLTLAELRVVTRWTDDQIRRRLADVGAIESGPFVTRTPAFVAAG